MLWLLVGCAELSLTSPPDRAEGAEAVGMTPHSASSHTLPGVPAIETSCMACDQELLVNGGFEAGTLEGWEILAGGCGLSDGLDWLTPEGSWMVSNSVLSRESCWMGQTIPLDGFSETLIDGGRLVGRLSGWLANLNSLTAFDDQVLLRMVFMDADGAMLAASQTLIGADSSWLLREAEGQLPPGTRQIRVELEGRYRQGASNESSADEVSLMISEVAPEPATITLPPMLQDHHTDAMRLLWQTDRSTTHRVLIGEPGGALADSGAVVTSTRVDADRFVHVADIVGLAPETTYDYQVVSGQDATAVFSMTTAPDERTPVRIAWTADNQDNPYGHFETHIGHIADRGVDLMISAGDIVQDGADLDGWVREWWDPLSVADFAQSTPVLVARGNHDAEHPYAYAYTALPENGAWYAFRYGPAFVVVLDTQAPITTSHAELDQVTFLEEALTSAEAEAASWRVVVFHNAPFTNAVHGEAEDPETGYGSSEVRESWVPLFSALSVDLVVSGHYHAYQQGALDGVQYVVIGGGGAGLAARVDDIWSMLEVVEVDWHYSVSEIDETSLRWSTYSLEDDLIDEVLLTR